MKAWGWGIFGIGVLIAVIGAAYAITEQTAANSMSDYERAYYPDVYENHIQGAQAGWAATALGLIIGVVGIVAGVLASKIGHPLGSRTGVHEHIPRLEGFRVVRRTDDQPSGVAGLSESAGGFVACPQCGQRVRTSVKFCPNCGRQMVESYPTMNCPRCGAVNMVSSRFCEECGSSISLHRRSGLLTAAGVMTIIASCLCFLMAIAGVWAFGEENGSIQRDPYAFGALIAAIGGFLGLGFGLTSGVLIFKRRVYPLVVIGLAFVVAASILSLEFPNLNFFLLFGIAPLVLGIMSMTFVGISRKVF